MRSTFHGLETSKRAILTQQVALQTVGHNIANASTVGYSRQRVTLSATQPMEAVGMQSSTAKGMLGTGVQYDSIKRMRDSYIDLQYRRENQNLSMWNIQNQTLDSIAALINEPSNNGLRSVMDKFWNSIEVLNRDPGLLSARIDLVGSAQTLTDTLNTVHMGLENITADIDSNISRKVNQANVLIQSITELHALIRRSEALGGDANDYRDQRDQLVDELSTIIDVQITETPTGDYSILAAGVNVVNNDTATLLTPDIAAEATAGELAGYMRSVDEVTTIRNQLNAMVNTLVNGTVTIRMENGYRANEDMTALNDVTLADGSVIPAGSNIPAGSEIVSPVELEVNGFNGIHQLGYTLPDAQSGVPFFVAADGSSTFNIGNIRVNPDVKANTNMIAASGRYEIVDGVPRTIRGNSDIALALSGLRDKVFTYPAGLTSLQTGTIDDYYRALTADLGTRMNNATRNVKNLQDLSDSLSMRRQQVSGVSLDEEMAEMIRFQHAYNAAARNMNTFDEMLDRVINQMGLAGR